MARDSQGKTEQAGNRASRPTAAARKNGVRKKGLFARLLASSHPVLLLIYGGIGAAAGSVLTNYLTFYTEKRDAVRAEFLEQRTKSDDVAEMLVPFSKQVLGKSEVTDEDIENLQMAIRRAYSIGHTLSNRIPSTETEFREYATALTNLNEQASSVAGPITGKPFVEAVGKFFEARDKFNQAVQRTQDSYWGS